MDVEIVSCGVNCTHTADFAYTNDKNVDKDCYFLVLFYTPFKAASKFGRKDGRANTWILYPPYVDVYHTSASNSKVIFINDWVFFKGDGIKEFIEEHNIPLNEPVSTSSLNFARSMIGKMSYELHNDMPYGNEKISHMFHQLMIDIARTCNSEYETDGNITYQHFLHNREKVFSRYGEPWTLAAMARLYGYSQSRFSYLYRRYFNCSPMDDLIHYRINISTDMLNKKVMSIEDIAASCGFNSSSYFSRTYKKICGKAPSDIFHT